MDRGSNPNAEGNNVGQKRKSALTRNPYEQCSEEILHWIAQSAESFANVLEKQLRIATIFNTVVSGGTIDLSRPIQSQEEYDVIKFLASCDAIKSMTSKNQKGKKESLKNWIQSNTFSDSENIEMDSKDNRLTALGKKSRID